MEVIQLLEMCAKQYTTIKKAFSRVGLIRLQDRIRPFIDLTNDEVFAYLMNWIINVMKYKESVKIRYRVDERTYQMKFYYNYRQLKVTIPILISKDESYILYEWTEEDTFNEMTSAKINASVQRAETKNIQVRQYAEALKDVAWVLHEPCPSLTAEDYKELEEILDV